MSKSDWEELSKEEHLRQALKDEQRGTQRSGDKRLRGTGRCRWERGRLSSAGLKAGRSQ